MAYITISELPELLSSNIQGSEYVLITNSSNESNRLEIGNMVNFIESNVESVINQGLADINNKIDNVGINAQITVLDEGNEIGVAKKINFIGATVNTFVDADTGTIDVYIPGATFSSNFNTNNNITDARITPVTTINRYISEPINNFYLGTYQPGTMQKCIRNTTLNYSTNDKFSVEANSKIIINIIQDTVVDSLEYYIEDGIYESNYITSNITNKQKELSHFTANFDCSLDLSALSGYVKINIKYIGSSNYEFIDDFFIDNSQDVSDIEIIPEIINNTYKYLSGVKFLSSGTQIQNEIILNNSMSYSFPDNLLDVDGSLAGLSTYSYNISGLGISNFIYNNDINNIKTFSILNNRFYNGELILKGRVNDWNIGSYKSFSINALVDTYIDNSTRIYEDFVTETYRLKNNLSEFNSIDIIDINELQVYNSKLVYPQLDFSAYYGNPDYSGLSGDKTYIRKFWHTGVSHSNGVFQINSNITEEDLSLGNVKIEISLDGVIWYNCCEDYVGGLLSADSGCRINSDSNSLNINNKIEFTLGLNKFTNLNSNWGIYLKITFLESAKNKYIDVLQINNWY